MSSLPARRARPLVTGPAARPVAVLLATLAGACAHGGPRGTATAPTQTPTVTAEDINRNPNVPIEEILRGRIAGVTVSRADDGGLIVRVRGATSFNSSDAPLYVVDGTPVQASASGSLTGINPYDIESIKVLKDPASLTMYGARGANGVILIKTKSAPKRPS